MAQAMVNFRMDEELKRGMEQSCKEMGMSMTTAFTIFATKVSKEKRIPFEVAVEPKDLTADWTKEYWDEVRAKLAVSEQQFENGEYTDAFESLERARIKYGL